MGKTQATAETCDNCGRVIGKLETPYVHGEHVVCADCYQRLHPQPQAVAYATPPQYAPQHAAAPHPPVQTIEATAKLWKAVQAIGVLDILVGVVMLIIGIQTQGNPRLTAIGGLLFVLGFIGYSVGRVCAWWFHG